MEEGKFLTMKQIQKTITVLVFGIFLITGAYADNMDGKVTELSSPYLLANAAAQGSLFAPQALAVNPAAAATVQRITFDGSYAGIIDTSDGAFGPDGHAVNFSAMFPSKVGVFTGSGHLLTATDLDSFDPGTQLSVYGAFS